MRFIRTNNFKKEFKRLSSAVKREAEKSIRLLGENFRYPSLHAKKMEGTENIWEARITKNYRFTFSIENDAYILRRIGTHNILKKEIG